VPVAWVAVALLVALLGLTFWVLVIVAGWHFVERYW
jgi:hypothetical protein